MQKLYSEEYEKIILGCMLLDNSIIDDVYSRIKKIKEYKNALLDNGYLLMSESCDRMSFNKGYTEQGFSERVFHLHLRFESDCDEIYFRDYLNAHPETAREYEALKISLCEKYRNNRDAYTEAKTEFVKKYTEMGRGDR